MGFDLAGVLVDLVFSGWSTLIKMIPMLIFQSDFPVPQIDNFPRPDKFASHE
jgi:hypothetical protein